MYQVPVAKTFKIKCIKHVFPNNVVKYIIINVYYHQVHLDFDVFL